MVNNPLSNPKSFVKNWEGKIVHLTMFGLPFSDFVNELKEIKKPLLLVVGAEKVPPWVFEYSDYNLSIGDQPHSEVSALAISLSSINETYQSKDFGGPLKVVPTSDHREMVNTEL